MELQPHTRPDNSLIMTIHSDSSGTGRYRYGFNNYEKDNSLRGAGNSYDFGSRIYDARIGKFLSLDRDWKSFPDWNPYIFALNNPIKWIDVGGYGPGDGVLQNNTVKLQVTTEEGVEIIYIRKVFYENLTPKQAQRHENKGGNGWYFSNEAAYKAQQKRINNGEPGPKTSAAYGADTPAKKVQLGEEVGERLTPSGPRGVLNIEAHGVEGSKISYGYYDADGEKVELGHGTIGEDGSFTVEQEFDISQGDGGLFIEGEYLELDANATTKARKGVARKDNPYVDQVPDIEDIQKLYDKSKSKSGTVIDVQVID